MLIFRHKASVWKRFKKGCEALTIAMWVVMFWRGAWLLADMHFYPADPVVSWWLSILLGVLLLVITRNFFKQFLGEMQANELKAEKTMFEHLMSK